MVCASGVSGASGGFFVDRHDRMRRMRIRIVIAHSRGAGLSASCSRPRSPSRAEIRVNRTKSHRIVLNRAKSCYSRIAEHRWTFGVLHQLDPHPSRLWISTSFKPIQAFQCRQTTLPGPRRVAQPATAKPSFRAVSICAKNSLSSAPAVWHKTRLFSPEQTNQSKGPYGYHHRQP